MATVREIARQAGVSKTTVSMVLNQRAGVSERMRKRVEDAIQALQTLEEAEAANEISSSVLHESHLSGVPSKPTQNGSPHNLLVLHPANIRSSAVFHEILRGIQAATALYHAQLNLALNEPDLLGNNVETLYFSNSILRPSGVLVIGAKIKEPVVEQACRLGIPVVLVGRTTEIRCVNAVARDEAPIAYEATQYLIKLGHRKIAFLGGSKNYSYTFDRIKGYRNAIEEAGLHFCEQWVRMGFDEHATAEFLMGAPDITAAVVLNELYASKLLPLVLNRGRQIPEDLSVITFDDTDVSRNFTPPLSSVSFPFYQEGFWGVRILMEQIRQPVVLSMQITLHATLMKRESCRPPRVEPQGIHP